MQGTTSIKFDDFRGWMVNHKDDPHFFNNTHILHYDYVYQDAHNEYKRSHDVTSYKFRFFSQHQADRYGNLHPEGIFLQLINNNTMILLITPKTVEQFIWGNHYSYVFAHFYERPWDTYQNIFDFHYTSYDHDQDQGFLINRKMYQFRNNKYYKSIDDKITDTAFARISLIFYGPGPERKMGQIMTNLDERKMVRDMFDVVHNENNYSMPLEGGKRKSTTNISKKMVLTGKRGGKYYIHKNKRVYLKGGNSSERLSLDFLGITKYLIIKIWNHKTQLWNHSVFLYAINNVLLKVFGLITLSNELTSEAFKKYVLLALDPKNNTVIFDATI